MAALGAGVTKGRLPRAFAFGTGMPRDDIFYANDNFNFGRDDKGEKATSNQNGWSDDRCKADKVASTPKRITTSRNLRDEQARQRIAIPEKKNQTKNSTRMKECTKKGNAGVMETMNTSPCQNVNYICGSAAEVERLWQIVKHVLSNSRSRTTPNLFQALVFLKVNREYWDCRSVQKAHGQARKEL